MIRHKCIIKEGQIFPSDSKRFKQELSDLEGKVVSIEIKKWVKQRTLSQNNALHLYCQLLSQELNLSGWDMKKLIRKEVDIEWTPYSVKEYLWRKIQIELFGKKSTAQLTTDEVSRVYENLNRIIGERTGVFVEFPNIEALFNY
uniref:Uncharacterized protein n=1 Tax=viral metagenome TaxID=1070528 RepID=A0A6H1ZFN4_9ZZZZ